MTEINRENEWINARYNEMSPSQRLGQLFMVRAFSKGNYEHEKDIERLIQSEGIGGLCFFQGSPEHQARLTNRYQQLSKIPLLISIDAEWGLGMRFKNRAISFPRQLTLGAIKDNRLIYDMGQEVARQLRRIGVHINFAPVVDINNNRNNPVINNRSFGENKLNVTAKSYAYIQGMQDGGVLACAKHFPGHGDTDVDSHLDLPVIKHDRNRLDSLEFFPFKVLSQHGMKSVMIAHLSVPALDSQMMTPTTLSRKVVTDVLKNEMGFKGLVITDALDMKGVTKFHSSGELEAKALAAGNDILLLSENIALAKAKINEYIDQGRIKMSEVEYSVKKILRSKYRLGLWERPHVHEDNVIAETITADALGLKGRLFENSMTAVKDDHKILPIGDVIKTSFGALSLGVNKKSIFQNRLESYATVTQFNSGLKLSAQRAAGLLRALSKKDIVFISLHNYSKLSRNNFGIGEETIKLIRQLNERTKVVLTLFGSPYTLSNFDDLKTVVVSYETDELAEDFTAQALFGVFDIKGILPVTASAHFKMNQGRHIVNNGRLGYVIPEVVGLDADTLEKMEEIVEELIARRAAPGCQILVSRRGKVVYHQAFGYHDYSKKRKVQLNDIYDLASITKIAATTLSLMKLYDDGKINLYAPLKKYFSKIDTSNKAELNIYDMLAHHAGLAGWIPFYKSTKSGKRLNKKYYTKQKSKDFDIRVCDDLYLRSDYRDTIWNRIIASELRDNNNYRYSDLPFYMFERLVKKTTRKRLDEFCEKEFYHKLGLRFACFNPIQNGIPKGMIVPSEKDNYFRSRIVQGYVHDMGAAMLGGVAGHAGLFANAHDLAIIMQLFLNQGSYGGQKFIEPSTIDLFTTRHNRSTRRALGFDMKELNPDKTMNMAEEASPNTFGHLGFTGTVAWVDPDEELIFIFLSNRTYPTMKSNKLNKENYRPKLQSVVYRSIIK